MPEGEGRGAEEASIADSVEVEYHYILPIASFASLLHTHTLGPITIQAVFSDYMFLLAVATFFLLPKLAIHEQHSFGRYKSEIFASESGETYAWKCQGVLYFFFDKGSFYKNTKGYKALVQAKCTQPDKRKKRVNSFSLKTNFLLMTTKTQGTFRFHKSLFMLGNLGLAILYKEGYCLNTCFEVIAHILFVAILPHGSHFQKNQQIAP
ncbi:hypothetical protein ACJX0J_032687 [Zea mays]